MKIKLRFWKCSQAASDGSRISRDVFQEYFNSEEYKEAIENKTMLSSLTHRSRDLKTLPPDFSNVKGTIGKNDALLIVDERIPSPVICITRMYYNPETDWVCADADVLDENGCDSSMSEQIKRFKSLVRAGVKLSCSGVIVGLWSSPNGKMGGDICKSIKSIRGVDITLDEAMKGARILDYTEEDTFDSIPKATEFDIRKIKRVKTFSNSNSEIPEMRLFSDESCIEGLPRTSKVGLTFTTLKVKEFSSISDYNIVDDNNMVVEEQKKFSVATLKERLRMSKLSPRQSFRRLVLDYKQIIRAQGPKGLPEEDEIILKSLFTTDVLNILKQIHPEILKGKQIATLLGASSLGKSTRVAAQKLQIPYKMITKEIEKNGAPTPGRFKKLSEAYLEFINSMVEEVFGSGNTNIKSPEVEEVVETVEEK